MTSRTAPPKRRRAAMTPKQRVLKKHPEAICLRAQPGGWDVWNGPQIIGSSTLSPSVAWELAARRIALLEVLR